MSHHFWDLRRDFSSMYHLLVKLLARVFPRLPDALQSPFFMKHFCVSPPNFLPSYHCCLLKDFKDKSYFVIGKLNMIKEFRR